MGPSEARPKSSHVQQAASQHKRGCAYLLRDPNNQIRKVGGEEIHERPPLCDHELDGDKILV